MTATAPTILATSGGQLSGGLVRGRHTTVEFGPLMRFANRLAQVTERRTRWCHLGTAVGDQRWQNALISEAANEAGVEMSHLLLFPKRSVPDVRLHILAQDVIWVGGGSIENMMALWRLHGLEEIFREAWQRGVVLAGSSAGSICWHRSAASNLLGPVGVTVNEGFGFLPFSNAVHFDVELERRERYKALVADGTLDAGYAVEDGVGLVYHGEAFIEAVSDTPGKSAWYIERAGNGATEQRVPTRVLASKDL